MYLDSAIILKLLVRESNSDWFEKKLTGHSFESSELAGTEVCSALLYKESNGDVTPQERVRATEKMFSMFEDRAILLLPLDHMVLERARAIQFACHPHIPLRTLDALHVATCDLHRSGSMAATDRRIRAACKQLGIQLLPREMEELPTNT